MDIRVEEITKHGQKISESGDVWSGEELYKMTNGEHYLYTYCVYDEDSPYDEDVKMVSSKQVEEILYSHHEFKRNAELARRGVYEGVLKQTVKRLAWITLNDVLDTGLKCTSSECEVYFSEHVAGNGTSSITYAITFVSGGDVYEVKGGLSEHQSTVYPSCYIKNKGDMIWF